MHYAKDQRPLLDIYPGKDKIPFSKFLQSVRKHKGLDRTLQVFGSNTTAYGDEDSYNLMLHFCHQQLPSNSSIAKNLFKEMLERGFVPTEKNGLEALRRLILDPDIPYSRVLDVFHRLYDWKLASKRALHMVLGYLCSHSEIPMDVVFQVLKEYEEKTGDIREDPRNYQHIISGFALRQDFVSMEKYYRLHLDLITTGTPSHMYRVILSHVPFPQLRPYLQDLKDYGIESLRHYNIVIARAVEQDQYEAAKAFYEELKGASSGLGVDRWSIGPLLKGCAKSGNYKDLPGYLDDILYYQIQKEESLYSLIISICTTYNVALGMKYYTELMEIPILRHPATIVICARFLTTVKAVDLLDSLFTKASLSPSLMTSDVVNSFMIHLSSIQEYDRLRALFEYVAQHHIPIDIRRLRVEHLLPHVTEATARRYLALVLRDKNELSPPLLDKIKAYSLRYFPTLLKDFPLTSTTTTTTTNTTTTTTTTINHMASSSVRYR